MKATEIRDKIFATGKILNEISNDLAGLNGAIEWDGIDKIYLQSKVVSNITNISKHIEGQLKHK